MKPLLAIEGAGWAELWTYLSARYGPSDWAVIIVALIFAAVMWAFLFYLRRRS